MNTVPPLALLYTAFTYIYELANLTPTENIIEDIVHHGHNLADTAIGILGFGGFVSPHFRGPVAFTNYGSVRGTYHRARNGKRYYFFKGIPYAKPPVGDLRFEPPIPHPGWDDIWDARSFRSECLQISIITQHIAGSENCLFLNIATRKTYQNPSSVPRTGLRPVIFWIHGGFFFFGGSDIYLPKYWMDEDVVVVTINYRLASLGFLNTGDGVVAGNMGIKDQVLALKWVNQNIKYFNGDPNRITLLGESAGGASAHYMTMSPMSRGLFSRAISLSGTSLCHWVFVDNPVPQARNFAEGLGCPTNKTREMVACLKRLPAAKLAKHHATFFGEQAIGEKYYFAPTVDSGPIKSTTFLRDHPLQLLKAGKVDQSVPWITGVLSGEGCINLMSIMRSQSVKKEINREWYHHAPVFFGYQNHSKRNEISDAIRYYYLDNIGISETTSKQSVKMFSDRGFYLDNHDAALLHSQYAPTYLYYWSYVGRFSLSKLLLEDSILPQMPNDLSYLLGTGREWLMSQLLNTKRSSPFGASHADDLPILFNIPGLRPEITPLDVDYKFSKKVIRLFVSFAETGIPNAGSNVQWNPVQPTSLNVTLNRPLQRLQLDSKFSIVNEPFFERLGFWRNFSIPYVL